jgi:hypothetical protein
MTTGMTALCTTHPIRVCKKCVKQNYNLIGKNNMKKPLTVTFRGKAYEVAFAEYPNKRTAIIMQGVDGNPDELYAVATVNLPDQPQAEGEVFIKNYSENEGVLEALEEGGVLKRTNEQIPCGYTSAQVANLTVDTLTRITELKEGGAHV